jgi:2-keto-4-pentenoate hydratase/2-oxohepta-3-ene-1,7-dioic acid hydratase in catechol pathway
MRFVRFRDEKAVRAGVMRDDHVVPIADPYRAPDDLTGWLGDLASAKRAADAVSPRNYRKLADVCLLAPIPKPRKFLAIGMNYASHRHEIEEAGMAAAAPAQIWFNKQVTCITGPYDDVWKPALSDLLDYEVELGIVMLGQPKNATRTAALEAIGGYTIINDYSVRDWQIAAPSLTMGKSFDTHGPCGPCIVTPDEIADPQSLVMRLTVNGLERQNASTSGMVADCAAQISFLSQRITLEPGDLIATGTPAGVGALMKPPGYLKIGDIVRAEIEGIGHIENRITADPRH